MENTNTKQGKIKAFIKKFGYYILAGCMVVAIAVTLAVFGAKNNTPLVVEEKPNVDVGITAPSTIFCMPLDNCQVIKNYSDSELQYNSTLKQWEAHKAVDLTSESSTNVLSVLDGKVTKTYSNYQEGTVVEIEHAGGIMTRYSSLDSALNVKVGDSVLKGQEIGKTSSSSGNEQTLGGHLHFQVVKDGSVVDPGTFLDLQAK